MKFLALFEGERAWLGSSEFYFALGKLGINYRLYELPCPIVLSAEEVLFYAESVLNDLRGKAPSEYLDYVKHRCIALKGWAERGYIVHVV